MAMFALSWTYRVVGLFIILTSMTPGSIQESYDSDSYASMLNCTTPDNYVSFHPTNASQMEDLKTAHRNTKDNQKHYDEQRLNRQLNNEQVSDRYPDDKKFSRRIDNLKTNRHKVDEDVEDNLKVYPLNSDLNDKKLNRNLNEQISRKSLDRESNRRLDTQFFTKNLDEQSTIGDLPKTYINQNLSKHYTDQYPDKRIENQSSEKHLDDLHPVNRYSDQNFERRLVDQYPDRRFIERNFERPAIDVKPIKYRDNLQLNKRPVEQHSDKGLDNYSNRYLDDLYPDRSLDDPNFKGRLIEKTQPSRFDDLPSNKHFKDFERRLDESTLDGHLGDLYSNKRLKDTSFDSRFDESNSKAQLEDYYSERRLKERNFERPFDEATSDERRKEVNREKHLKELDLERRLDESSSSVVHPESSDTEKHFKEPNFERHFDETVDNNNSDNLSADKHAKDSSFERRLEEPSDGRLEGLHPDRRIEEQNYERHLTDQNPVRRPGSDVRTDRRLSDEEYERHAINKIPSRLDEEHSNEEINPDRLNEKKILDEDTTTSPRQESNASHLMTFTLPKDWEEGKPKLNFPKKTGDERYKMATLHLDKGIFAFDFLRHFLSLVQPRDFPLDLLKDTVEGKVKISTLIQQTLRLEIVFIGVLSVLVVLMFVVPGTELWLCCRPHRYNYQRRRNTSTVFFLFVFTLIIGACIVTMLICNEEVAGGIDKIPQTVEAALQDLRDYHSGTVVQLRKCLTRSLDVASEAVLADLDNVEDLLGKPVQAQLSSETGVDVALNALMDVANASQELAFKTDGLLKRAERAREFGSDLSREADDIRRDLERTTRGCAPEDRALCAVLDPSGLHLALRLDRVARDDRLLRLRSAGRENLTEAGRQARGEYLYVPHHVARTTLEARNQIRREINTARAKVSDESRSIEASGSDLSNQLDTARRVMNQVVPYVQTFEYTRWFVGFGTAMCVLLVWLLLFGALCCRCGSSESRVRPTLLWFAFLSCLVSLGLWLVLMASLTIASQAELLLCRPLDDPEYRAVEAVLESKLILGRRISVSLKDLFDKCDQNDAAYQAFQLDHTLKLEQLTAHWTWTGLSRAFAKLKVDLTGLRILPPNLRERLQNLLYACGSNLTEHRIMIQGPVLNKDLNALSDQVENVARQLNDRRTARSFQTLAAQMRDLLSRRVKPLMKMQDELVYQLAALDLHLQPLQRQVNQTLTHLRNVQYFIDNQGEKIGLLKTKAYVDRLGSYLDQWRAHVLTEMSSGVAKCRPLWDILQGIKLLLCSHILGPLNGFWFATFICAFTMLISTPTAHNLASTYWRPPSCKGSVLLSRQGSPDTVVVERETWRTPDPPPSTDSW